MTKIEIIVLIVIFALLAFIGIFYYIHSLKINPPKEKEKQQENKDKKEEKPLQEQKPVPVGIIKQEIKNEDNGQEYDLAPFRETAKEETKPATENSKSVKEELLGLSQDAKKVILSDMLKPRF